MSKRYLPSKQQISIKWFLVTGSALLACSVGLVCYSNSALAQITPDDTLGEARSSIRDRTVRGRQAEVIEGGAIRGTNLFHSFRDFNVAEGQRVFFDNPSGIENILGRVTGNTASDIRGVLGVNGTANLFLINPNGIIFGSNARLDISGSFTASTGRAFTFADGSVFSTVNPQAPPLLTISTPIGIQLSRNPSANILVQGILSPGRNLTLQAEGSIEVNRGGRLATQTYGLTNAGDINLWAGDRISINGNNITKVNANGTQRSEPDISSRSYGATSGESGSITFVAQSVELSDRAQILTETQGAGRGGNIDVQSDSLNLSTGSRIDAVTLGAGQGGDINIAANRSVVVNNSVLRAGTTSTGNSGNLTIRSGDSVLFSGRDGLIINDTVGSGRTGDAGNIDIYARNQIAVDGNITPDDAAINGATIGSYSLRSRDSVGNILVDRPLPTGNGGNISLRAGVVEIRNGGRISADIEGKGQGGNIVVQADVVRLRGNRASIITSTLGSGQGGTIDVTADRLVDVSGNGARLEANTRSSGQSGNIEIRSGNAVALTEGGIVNTYTSSSGGAGNVVIQAQNRITLNGRGTSVLSTSQYPEDADNNPILETAPTGNGGEISLRTNRMEIRNGAQVIASTQGNGQGGDITVNAGWIRLNDIKLNSNTIGAGAGGSIRIRADRLIEANRSTLSASTSSIGNGGNITIFSRGSASFTNGTNVNATTTSLGNAGAVDIQAHRQIMLNGAQIYDGTLTDQVREGESQVGGRGGNLSLRADRVSISNDSKIVADTRSANPSGNITIEAGSVRLSGSGLNANTSGDGDSGDIRIRANRSIEVNRGSSLNVSTAGAGEGGDIMIRSRDLTVSHASINASTSSSGNAGGIDIDADHRINIDGAQTFIRSSSQSPKPTMPPSGNGGEISLRADQIEIQNGASVRADTQGTGRGGTIAISSGNNVSLTNDAEISAITIGSGPGGTVRMQVTGNIVLDNGAINVLSYKARGRAGVVNLSANSIFLDHQGMLDATSTQSQGGDINLTTENLVGLRRNSSISATSNAEGSSDGNIKIGANFLLTAPSENSDIIASSTDGGKIDLQNIREGLLGFQVQPDFALTLQSDITSTGGIFINPNLTDPSRGLIELPTDVMDTSNQIDRVCPTQTTVPKAPGEFVITGRGGLPPNPDSSLHGDSPLADWVSLPSGFSTPVENLSVSDSVQPAPVEAQGWVTGAQGEVKLIASLADTLPLSDRPALRRCAQ